MADDLGERSEAPTGKKRSDAREKGQAPKSQDFAGVIVLFSALLLMVLFGSNLIADASGVMVRVFESETLDAPVDVNSITAAARFAFITAGRMALPILLLMFIAAYLANFIQVGWIVSSHPIKPDLNKLNPIKGFQKTFGKKGLIKTGVNLLKILCVTVVTYLILSRQFPQIISLPRLAVGGVVLKISMMAIELSLWLILLLLLVGIIDLIFQRWQHTEDLKMTKQEVKDERKSMEGDPEIKGRRLRMARDVALQRAQNAVPEADVIITNPTHFSVAIRYDASEMAAPKVVASGVDFMAMRIRQLAIIHDVPMVERPPLARALYYGCPIGHEVPAEHFQAVAEVLAYIYRIENRTFTGSESIPEGVAS